MQFVEPTGTARSHAGPMYADADSARVTSALEGALHSTGATLSGIEAMLQSAFNRLTGPVPTALEKASEQMPGIVSLAERNNAHAGRIHELAERLANLI